jgi:ABC-2 type transport system ATP-binding protein
MNAIIAEDISKKIKNVFVLKDINLRLDENKIYGLVGRNGSGKTMLLRMLAGLIQPTEGRIRYEGVGKNPESGERNTFRVGITIESSQFYPAFTGYKNLRFLAEINNFIGASDIRKTLLDVGLDPNDKRIVRKYSMGMKQRLAIAQAIMENPDILLLDEPTNGLDKEGIPQIQKLIKDQARKGSIVVIASHSTEDIDILCDEIFLMEQGRIFSAESEIRNLSPGFSLIDERDAK